MNPIQFKDGQWADLDHPETKVYPSTANSTDPEISSECLYETRFGTYILCEIMALRNQVRYKILTPDKAKEYIQFYGKTEPVKPESVIRLMADDEI